MALLKKYLSNCKRLQEGKLLQGDFPSMTGANIKRGEGVTFKFADYQYGNVCELLHLARPIFLSREPASFEKTMAVFGKKSQGNALAEHLKSIRRVYEKGDYQPIIQIRVNETPLFHEETLKAWLNGVEYHQDGEKAKIVKELEDVLGEDAARGIFVSQLSGRIRATFMLADLVDLVVSKEGE